MIRELHSCLASIAGDLAVSENLVLVLNLSHAGRRGSLRFLPQRIVMIVLGVGFPLLLSTALTSFSPVRLALACDCSAVNAPSTSLDTPLTTQNRGRAYSCRRYWLRRVAAALATVRLQEQLHNCTKGWRESKCGYGELRLLMPP